MVTTRGQENPEPAPTQMPALSPGEGSFQCSLHPHPEDKHSAREKKAGAKEKGHEISCQNMLSDVASSQEPVCHIILLPYSSSSLG